MTPCDTCGIPCDILSFACRLTPREAARLRPDLIQGEPIRNPITVSKRRKKQPAEQLRANWHRYYERNKEKVSARNQAYGKANIEKRREYQRAYYQRKRGQAAGLESVAVGG